MAILDMSKYGIPQTLHLSGAAIEYPATTADVVQAPIVFLVDENHDPANKPAVLANAKDVAQIPQLPQ